ncbi:MAG TPA: proline--tRNA ligase [archaeon]|nr:proline--tRNA ligase [archaeon]
MSEELGISAKRSDFSEWYNEIVRKCGIMDIRYPVKGFPVYMPWGMFMIKQVSSALERELEATGHFPVNFPVLIPEKNLQKEKEHVKGFEKEVFWITHAGENKLDERLFLRPTSETAFYPMYSLWIRSHADLPLKLYQTVQVYRYETKMTKPLLRGREFFWLESHTAQKSNEDAEEQIKEDMQISRKIFSEILGIPFLLMQRPEWDKFPGAEYTYAYDTLLPDGRTIQIATTHNLGQKFAKAFDIKFSNDSGIEQFVYQTCFGPGVSRIAAAIIAVHGDDKGLVLPPGIAINNAVIIPIMIKGHEEDVLKKCQDVYDNLKKYPRIRACVDLRGHRPGFKFNEWEMKGVPLRIEIGPKDVENNQLTAVRRDTGEKIPISIDENIGEKISGIFDRIFDNLKEKAEKSFKERIFEAKAFDDLKKCVEHGFVKVPFCSIKKEGEACAEKIEKEAGAKIRGILFGSKEKPHGSCIVCGKDAKYVIYAAKAY